MGRARAGKCNSLASKHFQGCHPNFLHVKVEHAKHLWARRSWMFSLTLPAQSAMTSATLHPPCPVLSELLTLQQPLQAHMPLYRCGRLNVCGSELTLSRELCWKTPRYRYQCVLSLHRHHTL